MEKESYEQTYKVENFSLFLGVLMQLGQSSLKNQLMLRKNDLFVNGANDLPPYIRLYQLMSEK